MSQNKVLNSIIWKFLERSSIQVSYFLVTLILARLLSPAEYGSIAIVMIFIAFSTVLVQSGLNAALIREPKVDFNDFSTIFWISLLISIILYLFLFFSSNSIAIFFNMPHLGKVLRILALILIPGALKSTQVAYATRNYQFRTLFVSSLISSLVSGTIAIIIALLGYGIWSLVALQLLDTFINAVLLYFIIEWKPKFVLKRDNLKVLFKFGVRVLGSNLLNTIFMNLRSLIIGRFYSASQVAYFNKGKQFPQLIMETVNGSVQSVMLPLFSGKQDDIKLLSEYVKKTCRASIYLIFPCMIGLTVVAKPLVLILLTDKWVGAIFYLQIFSLLYITQPTQIINTQAIMAIGKSGTLLKLDALRKSIELICLIFAIPFGVKTVALSALIAGVLSMIITMKPINDIFLYTYKEQISDVLHTLFLSLIMAFSVYLITRNIEHVLFSLISQILIGIVIYILLSLKFKPKGFIDLVNFLHFRK